VQKQEATIIELSSRSACIAHACTWDVKEGEEVEGLLEEN
jgi:hypothetical protein